MRPRHRHRSPQRNPQIKLPSSVCRAAGLPNVFVGSNIANKLIASPFSCGCGDRKVARNAVARKLADDIVQAPSGACLVASPSIETSIEVAFSGADDNEFQPKVQPCRRPSLFLFGMTSCMIHKIAVLLVALIAGRRSISTPLRLRHRRCLPGPPTQSPTFGSKLPAAKAKYRGGIGR